MVQSDADNTMQHNTKAQNPTIDPEWPNSPMEISRCMHRASYCNVYIKVDQLDAQILIMSLLIIKCSTCFGLDIVGTVYHLVIYIYAVQQDTQCGLNE